MQSGACWLWIVLRFIRVRHWFFTLLLKSMLIFSTVYACSLTFPFEAVMRTATKLKRASFFVDEATVRRAQKVLEVKSRAEVIRLAVERVIEMEEFWRFMEKSRGTLKPGSFATP
jgi:hypothetical protein